MKPKLTLPSLRWLLGVTTIGGLVLAAASLRGVEPPDPGALEAYQLDGTYARRLEAVRQIGNHKLRADVAHRTSARLNMLFNPGQIQPAPLPRWQGMPTKGTNKI